ncbi:MAG: protoporphyrinogen oxidase [Gemmatimonadetes bacterium]|nr:protoporphyrinogen oxidase [Gemmatimonadota bacterium]
MIVIVGGGISGLAVAHHLVRRGTDVRLFEAGTEFGGVMRSRVVEGRVLDLGPQRTRLTSDVRELVEGAGLGDRLMRARGDLPLFVYRRGRLRRAPLSLGAAVTTDLFGWGAKLRALVEPLTGGPREGESVEAFFVRKFGREVYEALLGPLYGGLYASDPARMKVGHGLARTLREMGAEEGSLLLRLARRGAAARRAVEAISFEAGMGALPAALARRLGDRARAASPVTAREPAAAGGWEVTAGGEAVRARAVVLAAPADAVAAILPPSARNASRRLASLRYNPLAVVHLHADASGLEGFGYQVAFGESLETRGVTWNASIFGRDGVFTAYLGGMANPGIVEEDDERLGRLAAAEFETVTGRPARPLLVSRLRQPAWDATWDALDGLDLPPDLHPCAAWYARPGVPGRAKDARALAARLAGG